MSTATAAPRHERLVVIDRAGVSDRPLSDAKFATVRLPHPRTGESLVYLLLDDALHELNRVADPANGSWLIGESAQQDGSLLVATPMDPCLFVLKKLLDDRRAAVRRTSGADGQPKEMYRPLSDVCVADGAGAEAQRALGTLCAVPGIGARLARCCDVNDKFDEPYIRYNQATAVAYLRAKVERVRAAAPQFLEGAAVGGSTAGTLVLDEGEREQPGTVEGVGALSALALVGEYLCDELLAQLCEAYGLSVAQVRAEAAGGVESRPAGQQARASVAAPSASALGSSPPAAAAAAEQDALVREALELEQQGRAGPQPLQPADPTQAPPPKPAAAGPAAKKARLTPGQAALAKADTRKMSKMTAFFGKKA